MNTAEMYRDMISQSDKVWAKTSCEVAASHIANLAISAGALASIRIDGQTDPLVEFSDGSLMVFKKGNWVARGFYVQTQDAAA